jgi:hypothetical protein
LILPLDFLAEMPGAGSARFQQKGEPIVTEGIFISTKILILPVNIWPGDLTTSIPLFHGERGKL